MANSDNSVEVRITGSIDPSVQVSANSAKAAVAGLRDGMDASGKAMALALQQVGGNVAKLTPEILAQAQASLAGAAAAEVGAEAHVAAAAGVEVETVALAANTKAVVSNRAAYELMVLVHEAASGRFTRMAGSSLILAQALGGQAVTANVVAAAMNPLVLVTGALVVATSFLAYQEYEAEKAARATAEAFALSGRGAIETADAIRGETDELSQLQGVSRKAAEELLNFDATHAQVDARLANAANQLIPQYVEAFGKQGPAALNKMKLALSELSGAPVDQAVAKFDELNRTTLNLAPAEVSAIEGMLRIGDATGAVTQILADLASQGGAHILSFNSQIVQTQAELNTAKLALDQINGASAVAFDPQAPFGYALAVAEAARNVDTLKAKLAQLKAEQAKGELQAAFNTAVTQSNSTLASLRDNATRAKDAVKALHDEMATRRAQTPNDPTVTDYFANQGKYDKALEHREDPGDFKKPKKPKTESMGTEWQDELRAAELGAVQQGQGSADQLTQVEVAFWQQKVAAAKVGSAQYKQALEQLEGAQLSAAKKGAQESREISLNDISTQIEIEKAGAAEHKALIEADFQAGIITAQQKHDRLAELLQQEAADEIASYEAKKKAYGSDVVAVAAAANQEKVISANLAAELAQNDRRYTEDHKVELKKQEEDDKKIAVEKLKVWKDTNNEILSAERELVSGILGGRQTLSQIVEQIAVRTAEKEISADIGYFTERKLLQAEVGSFEAAKEQGGLLLHLLTQTKKAGSVVTSQAVQTGATAAGVTARTSIEAAGHATSASLDFLSTQKVVLNAAVKAAAGAYSALAGIPIIGPALGAAAAAVTFTAVEGFGALASLDVGTNYVPQDMVAQIHEGERVIPAADNRQLMALAAGGSGGRAGSAGDVHNHFGDFVVHGGPAGMSPSEFKKALSDHATHVAGAVHAATRGGWRSTEASPFRTA